MYLPFWLQPHKINSVTSNTWTLQIKILQMMPHLTVFYLRFIPTLFNSSINWLYISLALLVDMLYRKISEVCVTDSLMRLIWDLHSLRSAYLLHYKIFYTAVTERLYLALNTVLQPRIECSNTSLTYYVVTADDRFLTGQNLMIPKPW